MTEKLNKRKLDLLKKWAHHPAHSWLKEEPIWQNLLAEFWCKLPQRVIEAVLAEHCVPLIILPPVTHSQLLKLSQPFPKGAFFIQVHPSLLNRPRAQALAILAHELAHALQDSNVNQNEKRELDADLQAASWGFQNGLFDALVDDLGIQHKRVQNLKKLAMLAS